MFGSSWTPAASSTSTIEPRWAGSMRRSATVTSSEPDAASAADSASSERNPPVPSSSRERSVLPAMVRMSVSVAAISASLDRAQDLHPRPFMQLGVGPLPARDDLGVDGDGDAAARAGQVERLERGLDGRAVAQLGAPRRSATTFMRAPSRTASGSAGAAHSGIGSPFSAAATRSAVTGVSRIPLR